MIDQTHNAELLRARLAQLQGRIKGINGELRTQLPADFEEQASDLENQDALQTMEDASLREIQQIEQALQRMADGTYGQCVRCGEPIAARRLEALPAAATCMACAEQDGAAASR